MHREVQTLQHKKTSTSSSLQAYEIFCSRTLLTTLLCSLRQHQAELATTCARPTTTNVGRTFKSNDERTSCCCYPACCYQSHELYQIHSCRAVCTFRVEDVPNGAGSSMCFHSDACLGLSSALYRTYKRQRALCSRGEDHELGPQR